MKALFSAILTVAMIGSSPMVMANCQNIARDLYTAQGYQQRCAYQLKQTPVLSEKLKQECAQSLSGADKNKLLNEANQQLDQAFKGSKKESCEAGQKKYN